MRESDTHQHTRVATLHMKVHMEINVHYIMLYSALEHTMMAASPVWVSQVLESGREVGTMGPAWGSKLGTGVLAATRTTTAIAGGLPPNTQLSFH